MNLVSWGTLAGVWIEPGPNGTTVTVVTKRRVATNAFTRLTETTFQERFAEHVRKLPASAR